MTFRTADTTDSINTTILGSKSELLWLLPQEFCETGNAVVTDDTSVKMLSRRDSLESSVLADGVNS